MIMPDSTDSPRLKPVVMPMEDVLGVNDGVVAYTGRAMAVHIAGEPVIIMASNLPKLNIIFNYLEAHLRGGKAELMRTLRTEACPEIVMMARSSVQLDEEL